MLKKSFFFLFLFILASCSVVMATRGNGVNPKELTKCRTRFCLLAAGASPVDNVKRKGGKLYSENFRALMPTGSAARAAMHGLLDVSTLGLWEVVGTPIEAVKGKKVAYVVTVKYDYDGNTIKHMTFEF